MASSVSFDETGRVRIIPASQSALCGSIVECTQSFVDCVDDFESMIQQFLIDVLEMKSTELNNIKLAAIGLNNKIMNEKEQRTEKENELKSDLKANQNTLNRLRRKHQSLDNALNQQNSAIDKLQKM